MAVSNVIRFGKDGGPSAGSVNDLWLPVYGGEVLAAFDDHIALIDKVRYKTIESGDTLKFPETWKIGSEYHEAGNELLGLQVESHERTITLDDRPLVSHFELDDVDQMLAHFEVRSEYSHKTGVELAKQLDFKVATLLTLASRDIGSGGSLPGGGIDGAGTADVDAEYANATQKGAVTFLDGLEAIAVQFESNDVPQGEPWYCCVKPAMWWAIRRLGVPTSTTDLTNGIRPFFGHADVDMQAPQSMAMNRTSALNFLNFKIIRSPNTPWGSNVTTGPSKYQGDFTATQAVCWHEDAIAVIQKQGITTETFRDVRRGSDFFKTSIFTGGGTLRPQCAIEMKSA